MPNTSQNITFTATDFYQLAEQAGVPVVSLPLPQLGSIALQDGHKGVIGLDNSRTMTTGEEQARLGHELGHCLYGGFYIRSSPFDVVERHEVRADRWYIKRAIPRNTLFRLLKQGYDAWEIAEQLNTTEEYVRRAYYHYKENP